MSHHHLSHRQRRAAGWIGAALLGGVAGIRAGLPLASLAITEPSARRRRRLAPPALLGAAAELVVDKLPRTGERTALPSLLARMSSGALAGEVVARRARVRMAPVAAVTSALVALSTTFLSHRWRRQASEHVPGLAAAVLEDLLGAGLAVAALGLLHRAR
jgi:hypothetical protein